MKAIFNLSIQSINHCRFSSQRIPSIKFLGPRADLPKHSQTPSSHPISASPAVSASSQQSPSKIKGPGINRPSVNGALLTDVQIEAINMGGFIDGKYLKVKPIQLKK